MTSHTGRLYALALALVVFFLSWAVLAARPWATSTPDARLRTLATREAQLRREAALVRALVAQRWATYHARLAARKAAIASAKAVAARQAAALATSAAPSPSPSVRVVTLPPLTITRTS